MLTALLVAFLSAQAADGATTAWQLHHGFREGNALLPAHPGPILAVKASYTVGVGALAWRWHTRHPKATKILLGIGTGLGTAAALHNLHPSR